MFGFGPKRSRVSKSVALSKPNTLRTRLLRILQDRNLQLQVSISAVAIILLVIALQAWRAPFIYRKGDYAQHGIAAKIDFERIDADGTELARKRAEEAVPWIFRHDPEPLTLLPEEFRATLGELVSVQKVEQLSPKTRSDLALTPVDSLDETPPELNEWYATGTPQQRFDILRTAIAGPDMKMAEQRIDSMVAEFGEFIDPILQTGVIAPEMAKRPDLTPDRRLLIVREGESVDEGRTVLMPRVKLQDQLNEAGQMGYSWEIFHTLVPAIRPPVVNWLKNRISPTLRYDKVTTTELIVKARKAAEKA